MTQKTAAASQTGTLAKYLGMALIWGSSFLFMKVALEGVSFGQVAWSRSILGAIVIGAVMLVRRFPLPRRPAVWAHFVVIAVFNVVVPHLLFAWAEQHVSSSIASIYNSFTPIATALLAALVFRVEALSVRKVTGIVVGVLGVLVIIAPWQVAGLSGDLLGQLACLAAAASYGVGIAYTRRYISPTPIPGTTVAFMTIGTAAVIMLALTPAIALGPVELDFWIVGSLLLLGGLGTGLAYMWNIDVLRAWGPTLQSTVTYLMPVVGVLLGVILLGETLSWHQPLGALVVLLGILVAQGVRPSRPPRSGG